MTIEQLTPEQAVRLADLQAFWDKCNGFDWFHEISDDIRVWQRGEADKSRIFAEAHGDKEKEQLWADHAKHRYSGSPWDTEKHPKPARPK